MKYLTLLLISAGGLFAQGPVIGGPSQPNFQKYQPTYEDVKSALSLTDEQLTKLKQMQQDKMAATQAFYSKMADKQKELNALLEANSTDAAHVGKLMLDLQQLRKQPPPGGPDIHDRALGILTAEQKHKLVKVEEAQKLRGAVDQAVQLALISPPAAPAMPKSTGVMHPMAAPAKQ